METREILLRCSICRGEKKFLLSMGQVRNLSEGKKMQNHCGYCGCPQLWGPAEPLEVAEPGVGQAAELKNVLVVDDDDLTLKLLQKVLGSWEAKIEVAQSGKEALTKLATHPFDLVICDINMPGMTGQELFRHVQENAWLPPQRIIFLTGDKSNTVKHFLDSSGCSYMYKPIRFLEFSDHVQAVLSEQEMS